MELQKVTDDCITVMKEAAVFIAAARKNFAPEMIKEKSLNSLVSYVDIEAEKMLVKGLKKIITSSGFITEEETIEQTKTEYTWIVDPLDGTTNFMHDIPVYSISVALQYNGETVMGVVLEINRDECFYAIKNNGAFLDGKTIKVTPSTHFADCIIATGFPYEKFDYLDSYLNSLKYIMMNARAVRRFGSAAVDLAYAACGRFDAFYEYNLKPWDVAAGAIIVQEAGGVVNDFSGGNNYLFGREIVGGNKMAVETMLAVIK